ncbi:alpha-mannosidase [Listeria welshimeri]|uniref:alpha-mannosidase n=1 Tax=Listeria welshimeri TaxID=1643 RepID=UPI00162828F9|nr:alpha-mannosidase [Listeria welshimeri]MBC1477758.1 alpha-mannosidase [Listeria welshimeri]MBF2341566.1 alpha-mannosidase [Listeria welshimeri]MBF2461451.1 alpha-mannosidase [Listeria welshimeri]MBF2507098.1 alpha-mannosidase [Listeria welshimeri]MBF2531159.1 alpha-mannosidase [Listeria welshimeri]
MTRKKAHIISHSHWDREWFLPLESLRFRLVTLMDEVEALLDKENGFNHFHMDGQMIMLEDYLAVKPAKKEKMKQLVSEGKLRIGPWYMLQDAFLTSGEANIRNLQYGLEMAEEFGQVEKIGYFPDTFGLYGQVPQLMRQAGFDTVVFGRGVNPTGFNNQVFDSAFASKYSEMFWESPDGSKVLGILLANWYSNGNEIPVDKEEAKDFWDKKLADVERFASTDDWLFMNGCDHQPVQIDLAEALEVARELYPDVDFVHSHFEKYQDAVKAGLKPEKLQTVHGELTSQQSDGWSTLANTASSRIYLKQANAKTERLLERLAEPLSVMATEAGVSYPHEYLAFAWKLLMENQIHDSITGCSLDEVHREMEARFEKVEQTTMAIIQNAAQKITEQIATNDAGIPITVFHAGGMEATRTVELELETDAIHFSDMHFELIPDELAKLPEQSFRLETRDGKEIPVIVESLGTRFNYNLPERKFRDSYFARKYKLTFVVENLPAVGYETIYAYPVHLEDNNTEIAQDFQLENRYLKVEVAPNGTYTILDKQTAVEIAGVGAYEDAGDIGNEYMFKETGDNLRLNTLDSTPSIRVLREDELGKTIEIKHEIEIPVSASKAFAEEKRRLVWHPDRKSDRSENHTTFRITTELTLNKQDKQLNIRINFVNSVDDHRLRVILPTGKQTETHQAGSVFEVVTRANKQVKEWTNPAKDNRKQGFVASGNMVVASLGLPEYEVSEQGDSIELTLLRAVSEIGDWGDFPAYEAECHREITAEFHLILTAEPDVANTAIPAQVNALLSPVFAIQHTSKKEKVLPETKDFAKWKTADGFVFSAWKLAKDNQPIIRFYQTSNEPKLLNTVNPWRKSTILEETSGDAESQFTVLPNEIITLKGV